MTDVQGSRDKHIVSAVSDGILEITFNRAAKRNALTYPMYESLTALLISAESDQAIRAVLLTGSGKYFTSGNDVLSFKTGANLAYDEKPSFQFMNTLAGFTKPVIAAVNGSAIGIGVTMLLHCDLVYATQGSSFKMPFLSLGLVPEFASTLILPALVGHAKAMELFMSDDAIDSEQVASLGIINQLLAPEDLIGFARSQARKLASKPAEAVQATKRLVNIHSREKILSSIDEEAREFSRCLQRPETQSIITRLIKK